MIQKELFCTFHILIVFLLLPLNEASLFCKKHKNHPLCIKKPETHEKPSTISKPDRPAYVTLDRNCDIQCIGDTMVSDHICGYSADGDFKVFRSECHKTKYNCENMQNFTTVHLRFCDEPTCVTGGTPVCARIGYRRYIQLENVCSAHVFAYKFGHKLKIVSNDKCDSHTPICEDDPCVDEYLPVCGVNREQDYYIFSNDCALRRHNCEYKETFRPTKMKYCGRERRFCDLSCPLSFEDPVCGRHQNGNVKIFQSSCLLDNFNCRNPEQYEPIPIEKCKTNCGGTNCNGANAVCGSNGIECKLFQCENAMLAHNCRMQKDFRVINQNQCSCEIGQCGASDPRICATSGTSVSPYSNLCALRNSTSCGLKQNLVPINHIFCENPPTSCTSLEMNCVNIYYPVCAIGQDKQYKWYNSPCNLYVENCRTKNDAIIVDQNYCKDPFNPDRCRDQENYDYRYEPVCAHDTAINQTQWFGNECSIRHYNCFFDKNFQVTDMVACASFAGIDANGNI